MGCENDFDQLRDLTARQLWMALAAAYQALAADEAQIRGFGAVVVEADARIEELESEVKRLRRLLGIDFLTGVPNHYHIMGLLEREIDRSRRSGSTFSLLFLDIDRFKNVNSNYGHEVGSAVLHELAKRLEAALRLSDALGRYGGEEFIFILPNAPRKGAEIAAERLRKLVAAEPFKIGDKSVAVTVSIGVAEFRRTDTASSLIEAADMAMLQAKDLGRNRVVSAER
ncbi:GGDEF domain-containing protein [Candidatus Falkowbacteria bacterium]|nr:GGDEF domain-containing protein [Candidatus Falkowbacteria bacterium]